MILRLFGRIIISQFLGFVNIFYEFFKMPFDINRLINCNLSVCHDVVCLKVLLELFQKLVGAAAIGGRARKREISLSFQSATEG